MLTHRQNSLGYRAKGPLLAALAGCGFGPYLAGPACAQGLFESFFQRSGALRPGLFQSDCRSQSVWRAPEPPRQEMGGSVVYCVRTCDGRYFPIQRTAGANPAQLCSSFCPAGETRTYNGSSIDHATGTDGNATPS